VTASLLQGGENFVHFCGEITPALRMVGLTPPHQSDDALSETHLERIRFSGQKEVLDWFMSLDLGRPMFIPEDRKALLEFSERVLVRLRWAWPAETFEPQHVVDQVLKSRAVPGTDAPHRFWSVFLSRIKQRHGSVCDRYYDLGRQGDLNGNQSAQLNGLGSIEEPPFLAIPHIKRPSAADLASRPLILKTPGNNYRLPFLRALFPNARFRSLHLVRHPKAAILGLIKGWRYSFGFQYSRVGQLNLADYAEPYWCFDMPPGWVGHSRSDLATVAAFQWAEAHRTILRECARLQINSLRVPFERLINPGTMKSELKRISNWVFGDHRLQNLARQMAPVMAVPRGAVNETVDNDRLSEAIRKFEIRALGSELGYEL